MRRVVSAVVAVLVACGPGPAAEVRPGPDAPSTVVLSVIGTNDLHGHVDRVAVLGGYLANLRRARDAEGGGVLLVDGGDMFQGTLVSNLVEGRSVVDAYDVVGYHAATVGNHEFDFGPVGPAVTPAAAEDDPRGALKARAEQASFALLTANILDAETGERVDWPDMPPTATVDVAGVRVGMVGVSTAETLETTIAANVSDLRMAPVVETVVRHARELREAGADVVVVAAHAGGACERFDEPDRPEASCEPDHEIFEVARALPPGLVDVIVAGHTHAGVAHRVNGVAVIESYAYGRAFGRVDLEVDPRRDRVVDARVHPPRELCHDPEAPIDDCRPGSYEGLLVEPDTRVLDAIAPYVERAGELRRRSSGVTVAERLEAEGDRESALGNLLADLILEAGPEGDVAVMNGGGIRASLRAGELTYGDLHRTFPFDNRFATVRMTVADFEALYARMLTSRGSFLSLGGARVRARCEGGSLEVDLLRPDGEPWADDATLTVVTSDFLATGGDRLGLGESAEVTVHGGEVMRDALFDRLRDRGGTLRAAELYDPGAPRVSYPGERPVTCEPAAPAPAPAAPVR